MRLTSIAQTAGPVIVLVAFIASDLSSRLLDAYPGSEFAWYLNLAVFRPFEIARGESTPLRYLLGPRALMLDLILLALVAMARLARYRLGIAFCANLGFGIAVSLAYAWLCGTAHLRTASLVAIGTRQTSDAALIGILLVASFAGFLMSHIAFVRACACQYRGTRAAGRKVVGFVRVS